MKLSVRMIIMSHLSDAQECAGVGMSQEGVSRHINFAKFLLLKYTDTSIEVDADKEYELFLKKQV